MGTKVRKVIGHNLDTNDGEKRFKKEINRYIASKSIPKEVKRVRNIEVAVRGIGKDEAVCDTGVVYECKWQTGMNWA